MNNILETFFQKSLGVPLEEDINKFEVNTERGRKNIEVFFKRSFEKDRLVALNVANDIKEINETFDQKLKELQFKLTKVVEKVRGAILAERGTSGAIYTTQIPINKQQISNKTTTRIEDGIAFGVPRDSEEYAVELTPLKLKNLSFNDLSLKSLNKDSNETLENFSIEPKTQDNTPIEFSINLSGIIRTSSSLVFDMKSHGIVEVYKNGQLFTEKVLIKNIIIPVDINTTNVALRVYPSIHRTSGLHFNRIGYTELIYNEATYFESKDISINKSFSQMVVDTCDNSNDINVDIDYAISINNGNWESFSPVMKHTALEKQSIITLDKTQILNMYESKGSKVSEGDYRFYVPPNLQSNLIYKHTVYLRNYKKISGRELIFTTQDDIQLVKQAVITASTQKLYINGREVEDDVFTLYKGVNRVLVLNKDLSIGNVNLEYLEKLLGEDNSYLISIEKDLLTDAYGDKYISLSVPEFIESFDKTGSVYYPGTKPKHLVNTIKIRAELKSKDRKTVPFISRILLRGI